MTNTLGDDLDLDYRPRLPRRRDRGIGVIGAGEIVQAAHLPAYRLAGFNVVAIFDVDEAKARRVAEQFGIPRAHRTLQDFLADDAVEVVDIAVPARHQREVVEQVVRHKRYLLCQKPLAETYGEAREIVEMCRAAGAVAAVNQQMRWAPHVRAAHTIIQRGWIGQPTQATIQVNVLTPWDHWPWLAHLKGMEFLYHSIHYMDAIRLLLGTPQMVFADAVRFPGQAITAETRTIIVMKYPGDVRGLIVDNHNNFATEDDWYATLRVEGTDGVIKGTSGALYNYPAGREDTLAFYARPLADRYWFVPTLAGRWFPHAFMGTMGELQCALEEGRDPSNSVDDNLKTLQMVFAAMRATEEGRAVGLEEVEEG
jgi:predicted dehydrogenase